MLGKKVTLLSFPNQNAVIHFWCKYEGHIHFREDEFSPMVQFCFFRPYSDWLTKNIRGNPREVVTGLGLVRHRHQEAPVLAWKLPVH